MSQAMEKKKYIGSIVFLMLLIGVTFAVLLKDTSIEDLIIVAKQANPLYIVSGVMVMFAFIACEALCVRTIMKSLGQPLSFLRSYKYAFIAFYYSSITPGSSGGQPMQLYYMKKDRINFSHSSLALLILVFVYQIVELGFGVGAVALCPQLVTEHSKGMGLLLLYGVAFNLVALVLILIAVFSKRAAPLLVSKIIRLLCKLKVIKDAESANEKARELIKEYQQGAEIVRKNPAIVIRVALFTAAQLFCKNLVPYLVYRAFGLNEYSLIEVIAISSILSLAVGSLPLPGAVGASEGGFMALFRVFFPSELLLSAMLLTRGISYYFMVLVSGGVSVGAHILMKRRETKSVPIHLLEQKIPNSE